MEYIELTPFERVLSEKEFLQAQMDIISLVKRHQRIVLLRKEEGLLKTALRKKIQEMQSELRDLEKHLPKTKTLKDREEENKKDLPKNRSDLEMELEEIKHKLAALQ